MWFLLLPTLTFADPIEVALEKIHYCEQANKEDLSFLIKTLEQESFSGLSHKFLDTCPDETKALMQLKRQERGSYVVETGTQKCIDLLKKSTTLLKNANSWEDLHPELLEPLEHDISVLKYLLLSLVLLIEHFDPVERLNLKLVYAHRVGKGNSRFIWNEHFHIPNCGYVFGGIPKPGPCEGLDCSAFVGHCIGFPGRLTTLFLEKKWLSLTRQNNHGWDDFLKLERHELEPSDLIFWRHEGRGHVMMFHFWLFYPFVYQALEATRGKHAEGIRISRCTFKPHDRCLRYMASHARRAS